MPLPGLRLSMARVGPGVAPLCTAGGSSALIDARRGLWISRPPERLGGLGSGRFHADADVFEFSQRQAG